MMNKRAVSLGVLMAVLVPFLGWSGQVGTPAYPLTVKEWIKGSPVEIKAGTNIYIVEIFATTSLASGASITNLNAIQKRYQDEGVVVVGISDESVERIKQFVQREGPKIEYAIAADDQHRTSRNYMMPVRQRGIPCAFIVGKDGKLLWYGHPLSGLDEALDKIIAGSYDLERARKDDTARIQMAQYLAMAMRGDVRTGAAGRTLLTARTNDATLLCDLAFQIVTTPGLFRRDIVLATAALDQAEKLSTTNATQVSETRAILLFETGKKEEALALARKTLAAAQGEKEKAKAELLIRTIEARLSPAKTNQATNPRVEAQKTNPTNQPAAKP
jgi:hypothetical protein